MSKVLHGKVAIVTGASSGIGTGIARMFAAEGAKTVIAARRKDALDEIAATITAAGGTALVVPTDVTKEGEVRLSSRKRSPPSVASTSSSTTPACPPAPRSRT